MWRALVDQLPDGWVAWHSLRVRTPQRQFGEGDFVIADPERGLLVLEVKGGEVRQSNGRFYYQGGRPMVPAPLEQAHGYARKLAGELARVCPQLEIPFGVAVCFPQTHAENAPSNSDLRDVVLCALELGELGVALARAFDATVPRGNAPRDRGWIAALDRLWGDDWEPRLGLLGRARLAEQRRQTLNDEQLRALRGLAGNPRVVVTGGAGTGKSTIAMQLAQDHAWAGRSLRYLCFARALAHWVDSAIAPIREATGVDARASAVDDLALACARAAGLVPAAEPQDARQWERVLTAAAGAGASHLPRPEILIIDEAQCLSEEDWAVVQPMLAAAAEVWIFRDRAQAYWPERGVPPTVAQGAIPYVLGRQERMPGAIEALARAYADGDAQAAVRAFDAELIRIVDQDRGLAESLAAEIDRLIEVGFAPHQLAVLSLVGQAKSALSSCAKLGAHRVVRADDPDARDHVVVDTFLRFQGLDRAVVILCEGGHPSARHNHASRMHMACTRASTGLVLVTAAEARAVDPVLSALIDAHGYAPGAP